MIVIIVQKGSRTDNELFEFLGNGRELWKI